MKIKASQLRRIIREELNALVRESQEVDATLSFREFYSKYGSDAARGLLDLLVKWPQHADADAAWEYMEGLRFEEHEAHSGDDDIVGVDVYDGPYRYWYDADLGEWRFFASPPKGAKWTSGQERRRVTEGQEPTKTLTFDELNSLYEDAGHKLIDLLVKRIPKGREFWYRILPHAEFFEHTKESAGDEVVGVSYTTVDTRYWYDPDLGTWQHQPQPRTGASWVEGPG